MATLGANVFTTHTPITLGLLRNGAAADVARTARESSLAPEYHFTGVRWAAILGGNEATFDTALPTHVLLEAQIRAAYAQLVGTAVARSDATHQAAFVQGGTPFDEATVRAAAAALPANRIKAIAIGAIHTALVKSYRIVAGDLIPTEVAERIIRVRAPAAAANEAAYLTRLSTSTAGWVIGLESNSNLGAATEEEKLIINYAPLTVDEVELAYGLVAMGQASPARAGAQLFVDGHHYHSDADSSARCRAIEREVTGGLGAGAKNLWRANTDVLRNAVWHAGIHFVRTEVLQGFAEDVDMPARLDATGFGSMSVGLPAQEDLFNRAGSYRAVYVQVSQTATGQGHRLSLANMEAVVVAMAGLPRRAALPAQKPAWPGSPASAWPTGCDTRAKALKLYLEPALDAAEPVAAWMFGFYREVCSRAGIRPNSVEGSLLRSYSLKRAVGNFLGEANRAQTMFAARARYIRTQAEEGNLETYSGNA